jgi:hypothetical protein
MRRLLLAVTSATALLVVSTVLVAGVTAAPSARAVDRTFICMTQYGSVEIVASPHGANELEGARFISSGYGRVSWGPSADPGADLVAVALPGLRNGSARFPAAVYASARRCSPSAESVPLTRKSLPGPPTHVRGEADCDVPARVLVRVRAVLAQTAIWRRLGVVYVGALGPVVQAELAVRDARTRRPLAFITLNHSGETKLWSSPDCS